MFWMIDNSFKTLAQLGERDPSIQNKRFIDWYCEHVVQKVLDNESDCLKQILDYKLIQRLVRTPAKYLLDMEKKVRHMLPKSVSDETLGRIFDYNKIISSDKAFSYAFATYLDTNSCVYCGRSYTTTFKRGKSGSRPDFDHFYPQNEHPLLKLCFHNLIPCCVLCNRVIKGKREFNKKLNYAHPYTKHPKKVNHDNYFYYDLQTKGMNLKLGDVEIRNMSNFMYVKEMYQFHENFELKDYLNKQTNYPDSRVFSIALSCNMSPVEVYSMLLGSDVGLRDREERHKPLFKLKNDLARDLFPVGYRLLRVNGKK